MDSENVLPRFIHALNAQAPNARAAVEKNVRQVILGTSAGDILTFRVGDGTLLTPAASIDYAKALWCFVRETRLDGQDVESLLNEKVLVAVQQSISEILLSETAMDGMLRSVDLPGIGSVVNGATRDLTSDEIAWMRREASALLGMHGAQTIQSHVAVTAIENTAIFMKSAAGAVVMKLIGHLVSTTAGKVMVSKLLYAAAGKAVASAAFKAIAIGFLKKAGLVVIVKAAIAAAAAAGLPMTRFRRVPPMLVPVLLVGALAVFLAHELWDMPNKLAKTLPGEIANKIVLEWGAICDGFATALTDEAFETIVGTPVRDAQTPGWTNTQTGIRGVLGPATSS